MIQLEANWLRDALHVWATRPLPGHRDGAQSGSGTHVGERAELVSGGELRGLIGDVWDSLLVHEAIDDHLTLQLPFEGAALLLRCAPSPQRDDPKREARQPCPPATFRSTEIDTLAFTVTDAVDFLASVPLQPRGALCFGDSVQFWQRTASLVLEILARQRYVPAIDRLSDGRYRGHWRVVVDDDPMTHRLRALTASIPRVCRSFVGPHADISAADLVEGFVWRAIDALVRRCLEGDELAHTLMEQPIESASSSMLWLRSLVSSDAVLVGEASKHAIVHTAVSGWLQRLEPPPPERMCRTCLRLHPPEVAADEWNALPAGPWRITVHAQALRRPRLILDADALLDATCDDEPRILPRPFHNALEQVRADLEVAARFFPALLPLSAPDGPLECTISLEDAYAFLRDAAPMLESKELTVWTPDWWLGARPRLHMALDLRPLRESDDTGGQLTIESLVDFCWRVAVGDEELTVEELTRLAEAKTPLVRFRGSWTEVRPAEIRQALEFLQRHRGGRMKLFEALRLVYAADDLNTGLPVTDIRAHGWIEQLLSGATDGLAIEFGAQPEAFRGELRPYQLKGMAWLGFLSRLGMGACLADDMGLGKTIQLIALLLSERTDENRFGPTLLVVPTSLVGNWQREIARFGPMIRVMIHHGLERLTGDQFVRAVAACDVVISTYSLAHRDFDHLSAVEWHRVTLDEAQNIKNPAAKQTKAIRSLQAVHRVALTGTPIENRLSELWSILDFLNPGYLGSATDFRRRFAVPIERYRDADRAQRLRHLIRPFVLRRLKSDPAIEADLPEKMEMKVFCNLTTEQAGLYETIVSDMLAQIDQSEGIQRRGLILKALVRLKQICNHPALVLSDGSGVLPHRSGKCDRLIGMLEEILAEGDCALVFTQFRTMGELLVRVVEESLGKKVLFLHGGTPRAQRDDMVARFQERTGETPIFILSLRAGGFGLNLTAATHVFHFDRWWNPAVEDQATDRAHRIGQDRRVQVHKFICAGTLEERIDGMLTQKRALAQNVVGTGEDWLTDLSTAQLRDVFALAHDAVSEDPD